MEFPEDANMKPPREFFIPLGAILNFVFMNPKAFKFDTKLNFLYEGERR
jgi:hypothetical protein